MYVYIYFIYIVTVGCVAHIMSMRKQVGTYSCLGAEYARAGIRKNPKKCLFI